MATLEGILEKHHAEWKIIMILRCNVNDYHKITAADFITSYSVRKMLGWRSAGNKFLLKLAELLDKEGLSLRF